MHFESIFKWFSSINVYFWTNNSNYFYISTSRLSGSFYLLFPLQYDVVNIEVGTQEPQLFFYLWSSI